MAAGSPTVIKYPPYTLAYDGSWTVRKTVKSKEGKEREEIVGYYGHLQGAVWYGLINDCTKALGDVDLMKAANHMSDVWQDIREAIYK